MIIFKTNLLQTLQRDSIDFKQNIFITIDTES